MREIHTKNITVAVRDLCISANIHLGEDVLEALKKAMDQEVSPTGADFANEVSAKDGLKLRCQNVKLFFRKPQAQTAA